MTVFITTDTSAADTQAIYGTCGIVLYVPVGTTLSPSYSFMMVL